MKILNTAIGIIKAKFFGRPFYTRFHATHRCNHQCRMCGLHRLADRERELSIDKIAVVARRLAGMGARHVVITGGEAFLRTDIVEIVELFAAEGFSVRIQTNGGPHVTRRLLSDCAAAGLRDISVSIDSLDRRLQDDICRGKDVVDNALRTLKLAAELLPDGISQANVVASRYNFSELPSLVRFFHGMGVYTYITPVMISVGGKDETRREYLFRSEDEMFVFSGLRQSEINRVIDELTDLRRAQMGLTNSTRYLNDFRDYLLTGSCEWKCEAGTLCLDIHPDGGVCICKEKPPVGNILDEGFVEYYRSDSFRKAARLSADNCTGCFYGEYREPQYAVRDLSVFAEWVRDWLLTFRRGMKSPPSVDDQDIEKPAKTDPVASGREHIL